jgi:hypothetical protein
MKPIISKNLTPLPPFPTREWGFQSLSPRRGEVWRGVNLYIQNFSNILLVISNLQLASDLTVANLFHYFNIRDESQADESKVS